MKRGEFTENAGFYVAALALIWLAFRIWKDSKEQKKGIV